MERVETLLKKLQEQVEQKAATSQLLLTVQMLQAELLQLQGNGAGNFGNISITAPQNNIQAVTFEASTVEIAKKPTEEERTVEVLQVDEAEIEAELEEIKRNAEAHQKITNHNKPHIVFESEEEIPTLAHQYQPKKEEPVKTEKKEINDMEHHAPAASINDKLKQSKIDLGDTLLEAPVRDLKKAIGVNDRFLYINELFRGDEVAYERSIKTINGFSILPEAEYWIQRELKVKNGWVDSNEVVMQFYLLVKRRFS